MAQILAKAEQENKRRERALTDRVNSLESMINDRDELLEAKNTEIKELKLEIAQFNDLISSKNFMFSKLEKTLTKADE